MLRVEPQSALSCLLHCPSRVHVLHDSHLRIHLLLEYSGLQPHSSLLVDHCRRPDCRMPEAARWTALGSLRASAAAHHHISFDYPCIVVVLQYSSWRNAESDFLAFHVLRSTVWAIFLN